MAIGVVVVTPHRHRLPDAAAVACAAIYLVSRAGSYLNGVVIPVDGGLTLK